MSFASPFNSEKNLSAVLPKINMLANSSAQALQAFINAYLNPGLSTSSVKSSLAAVFSSHPGSIRKSLTAWVERLHDTDGFEGLSLKRVDHSAVSGSTACLSQKNLAEQVGKAMSQLISVISCAVEVAAAHANIIELDEDKRVGVAGDDKGLFVEAFAKFRLFLEEPKMKEAFPALLEQLSKKFDEWVSFCRDFSTEITAGSMLKKIKTDIQGLYPSLSLMLCGMEASSAASSGSSLTFAARLWADSAKPGVPAELRK